VISLAPGRPRRCESLWAAEAMGFLSFIARGPAPAAAPISSPRAAAPVPSPSSHADSNGSSSAPLTSGGKRVSFQEVGALPAGGGLPPEPVCQVEAAPSTSSTSKMDPYTGMTVKSNEESLNDSFKTAQRILSTPTAKAPAPAATLPGGRVDPYAAFRNNYKRAG